MQTTRVTFPGGAVSGRGAVQRVVPLADTGGAPGGEAREGLVGIVVDVTPFHPLDHTWPDQPADTGRLAGFAVRDVLTAAVGPDGGLLVGADVPARRGDPDWTWHVLHVTDLAGSLPPEPGDEVDLEVDVARRTALSAGHTACHLAALALNAETADLWRKDAERVDSLGHPDLDQIAITTSRIEERGAFDAYRLGKSLRKKGFESADLLASLPGRQEAVNARLAVWVAMGAAVRVDTGGDDSLTARRWWTCDLPQGQARLPCGGSHVASLAALGGVSVTFDTVDDGAGLEVRTRVAG
jgi:alanyl-tRNA synthetase